MEITFDGKIYCYRSTVPDEDTLDITAMDLERKHKDASTAQALDDAIPMIAPTETLYVRCIDVEKGQYRLISKALYGTASVEVGGLPHVPPTLRGGRQVSVGVCGLSKF